jgi:hypothetical protein
MRRSLTLPLLLAMGLAALVARANAQESFTVVVLPDPQNYSEFFPAIFKAQTQWIVQNQAARNIKFVIGVGDMVNHAASPAEWSNADAAIRTLDVAGVPYVMAIGNHDYEAQNPSLRSAKAFNQYFGPQRYASYAWYGENFPAGSNENFFATFAAAGKEYLVLVLEMHPRASAVAWASSVIAAHPNAEVLLVTHSFMYIDDTRVDRCDTHDVSPALGYTPEDLWQSWARHQPQLSMIVSGHITNAVASRRSDIGENGNLVNQMLSNYQDMPQGGGGYLRLLTFNPAQNTIDVQTYSPYKNLFMTDAKNQFVLSMHASGIATGQGIVAGKVRSSTCQPLSGEVVRVGSATTSTDATGHFSIPVPAPAAYDVTVDAPNFQSSATGINVADSYSSEADFFLTAGTPSARPDFVVASNGPSSTTVNSGETATYKVAVTPAGGFSGAVQLACTGMPASATCAISPSSLNVAGGDAVVTVSVATGVRISALLHAEPQLLVSACNPLAALFAPLPIVMLFTRRTRRRSSRYALCTLAAIMLLLLSMGTISCGGMGGTPRPVSAPQSSVGSTPPGTYSVVITATSGALSHATSLTLIVR